MYQTDSVFYGFTEILHWPIASKLDLERFFLVIQWGSKPKKRNKIFKC